MIQFDMSYLPDDHSGNHLLFMPNYHALPPLSAQGIVAFLHSEKVVEPTDVASMRELVDAFGWPTPEKKGLYVLADAMRQGVPVLRVVTVPIGTPLSDAMWKLADDPDYEHAKYLQACLASIFPR